MQKKQIEFALTAALAIIFILAWANSVKVLKQRLGPKAAARVSRQAPAAVPVPQVPVAQAAGASKPAEPQGNTKAGEKDETGWVRCPFSGKVYITANGSEYVPLELSGILWDAKTPSALIDGQVVKEGDSVGAYKVMKIQKDTVTLKDSTHEVELKL